MVCILSYAKLSVILRDFQIYRIKKRELLPRHITFYNQYKIWLQFYPKLLKEDEDKISNSWTVSIVFYGWSLNYNH